MAEINDVIITNDGSETLHINYMNLKGGVLTIKFGPRPTARNRTTHGAERRDGASTTREEEDARIEAQQIRDAMPLIGPLLDRWDELPNDVRCDDELEAVKDAIERLDAAMEGPEE